MTRLKAVDKIKMKLNVDNHVCHVAAIRNLEVLHLNNLNNNSPINEHELSTTHKEGYNSSLDKIDILFCFDQLPSSTKHNAHSGLFLPSERYLCLNL